MIRSLQNTLWRVHSPSLFELVSDHAERVYLMYERPYWALVYQAPDGHTISRTFGTRDAAIALIAQRSGAA